VTLELSRLTGQMQAMGKEAAARQRLHTELVALARQWLDRHAEQAHQLRQPAQHIHAAIPTDEPIDISHPPPAPPERFTVIAADGSQIQPDRHGAALYYLVNVGSLVYRHGSGDTPEARSEPTLGYAETDVYENGMLVTGNLLDVRRDLAEIAHLADLCTAERVPPPSDGESNPIVALVDGTLLLWVLEERSREWQQTKVMAYLDQLIRIRESGASIAAFTSRPRRTEVTRLLHLANVGGEKDRALEEPNPLERLPDRALFRATLPPGARSALFVSPSPVNETYYRPSGHTVHFFYLNLAKKEEDPVIARIELPAWVAQDAEQVTLVHGAILAQSCITGDYPYALARADELAFISGPERDTLEQMVSTALLRAGVVPTLSPKAFYKTLTRSGRRRSRTI